jgi:hypothetical protein
MISGVLLLADPAGKPIAGSLDAAVESYEHLSIVLVEVRKTEDLLVKSIIAHHHQAAQEHLKAAQGGRDVLKHLEAAATEVTHMANEGDKRVLAIRQRLAKAGSTHKTDKETKDDYPWIDSREKKDVLAAAKSIVQLGEKATADQVAAAAKSLETLYQKAVAPE